ncbi:MAG TPA: GGDEF domain-containing protein [Trebonia sp.]|nr:GGDEF domain-containing protein [Trebonia sp.]
MLAVVAADLAWAALLASRFTIRAGDLVLFAALLACGAATVELSRRGRESSAAMKDVYAVWELPVAIHLPLLYALAIPAIRLMLTQWRVGRVPLWRLVFSAAATGLAYGAASLAFHAALPAGVHLDDYLDEHAAMWLAAAVCCGLTQWTVSQALAGIAVKAADPAARLRDTLLARESLHNDATALCAAILVALAVAVSPLTLIVAFPLGTLLQRSYRHAQLLSDARSDAKTGLLNAAAWEAEAVAEVARAVRSSSPLAVAVLDLDRFKLINDTYGHLVGDHVLKQIAGTMTGVLRDYDLAGRFGGEEFVMLLPQTRAVDALRIAERVRAHIAELPLYASSEAGAERVLVTVSIGVAALDAGSRRELPELLAAADAALYRAKASGRDQVQMISTSRGLSAARASAEGGLFDADARDEPPGDAGLSQDALLPAPLAAQVCPLPPLGPLTHVPLLSPIPQLPADGEADRLSTAITSALAV